VATKAGMAETLDGGKSWRVITPPLPQTEAGRDSGYVAFDPVHDIFYFSATDHRGHNQMMCKVQRGAVGRPARPLEAVAGMPETTGLSPDKAFEELKKKAGAYPVLRVKTLDEAPVLDGRIGPAFTKNAEPVKFRFLNGKEGEPQDGTTAWIVADRENLYIALRCQTKDPDKVVARMTEHDDEVYSDESVDIFIDPANSRKDCYTFHIIVNSAGVTWDDDDDDDLSWDPALAVKCGKEPGKAWIVEMKIPFADLKIKPDAPVKIWSFNLTRTSLDYEKPGKVLEDTAWSPSGSSKSNVPEKFGYLFLDGGSGAKK
jgi:hypothetical protein